MGRTFLKVTFHARTPEEFFGKYRADISPTGLFIRTAKALPVGAQVQFQFHLEGMESPFLAGRAIVIWVAEENQDLSIASGMELRFEALSASSKERFQQLQLMKRGVTVGRGRRASDEISPAGAGETSPPDAPSAVTPAEPRPAATPAGQQPAAKQAEPRPAARTFPGRPTSDEELRPELAPSLPTRKKTPTSRGQAIREKPTEALARTGGPEEPPPSGGSWDLPDARSVATGGSWDLPGPNPDPGAPDGTASVRSTPPEAGEAAPPPDRPVGDPGRAPDPQWLMTGMGSETSRPRPATSGASSASPAPSSAVPGDDSPGPGAASSSGQVFTLEALPRSSRYHAAPPGASDPGQLFTEVAASAPTNESPLPDAAPRFRPGHPLDVPRTGRRKLLLAGGVGLVALLLLGWLLLRQAPAPDADDQLHATPRLVRVISSPVGAEVLIEGRRVGLTPTAVTIDRSTQLVVRHPLYRSQSFTISPETPGWIQEDGRLVLVLNLHLYPRTTRNGGTAAPSPTERAPTARPAPSPTKNVPAARPAPSPTKRAPTARPAPSPGVRTGATPPVTGATPPVTKATPPPGRAAPAGAATGATPTTAPPGPTGKPAPKSDPGSGANRPGFSPKVPSWAKPPPSPAKPKPSPTKLPSWASPGQGPDARSR